MECLSGRVEALQAKVCLFSQSGWVKSSRAGLFYHFSQMHTQLWIKYIWAEPSWASRFLLLNPAQPMNTTPGDSKWAPRVGPEKQ